MVRKRNSSPQLRAVLAKLLEANGSWSYGYDLCKSTGIKSGTLYPLLIRLHDQGMLESEWQAAAVRGRPPRHGYRLTARGIALASAPYAEPARPGRERPASAS